jgi:hypothetical protein
MHQQTILDKPEDPISSNDSAGFPNEAPSQNADTREFRRVRIGVIIFVALRR